MKDLYDLVLEQVRAGMCQEDFEDNPAADVDALNRMENDEFLWQLSRALERLK